MERNDWREWLGRRIRLARETRGWKQIALAKASHVPQPTLSEAENGSNPLEIADLLAIARATEMPLSFFDPNRKPRHIAEAVLDQYPDMPAEYVRSLEKTAAFYANEAKGSQNSGRASESPSAGTSGTSATPEEPSP